MNVYIYRMYFNCCKSPFKSSVLSREPNILSLSIGLYTVLAVIVSTLLKNRTRVLKKSLEVLYCAFDSSILNQIMQFAKLRNCACAPLMRQQFSIGSKIRRKIFSSEFISQSILTRVPVNRIIVLGFIVMHVM